MDRVKWFWDRAERDRFQEEVEILESEFERIIKLHDCMASASTEMVSNASSKGAAAYAHKKVSMYQQLQTECKEAYNEALSPKGSKSKKAAASNVG